MRVGKANGSRECAPDDKLRVPTIQHTTWLDGGHGAKSAFAHPTRSKTYQPSSTILPRDLPDSSSACARLRLIALIVPKVWSSVVRSTPLSMRSATSLSRACWPIMSGVWNELRVNIDSQW